MARPRKAASGLRALCHVIGPPKSCSSRDAFEVSPSPLRTWIGLQQRPELSTVTGLKQMSQLVQDHVVKHPRRHPLDSRRDTNRPISRRAGTPPAALVGDPGNADRLGQTTQIAPRQVDGPRSQLIIARTTASVTRGQPADHGLDPGALLVGRKPRRDEHDRPVALAKRADRPASLPAAPDLDLVRVHSPNLGQGPDDSHHPRSAVWLGSLQPDPPAPGRRVSHTWGVPSLLALVSVVARASNRPT